MRQTERTLKDSLFTPKPSQAQGYLQELLKCESNLYNCDLSRGGSHHPDLGLSLSGSDLGSGTRRPSPEVPNFRLERPFPEHLETWPRFALESNNQLF